MEELKQQIREQSHKIKELESQVQTLLYAINDKPVFNKKCIHCHDMFDTSAKHFQLCKTCYFKHKNTLNEGTPKNKNIVFDNSECVF
jgi:hypothetical protein